MEWENDALSEEEMEDGLVTIEDEEGHVHAFELLDAIETDAGRYVALLPVCGEDEDPEEGDDEAILLEVIDEDGQDMLVQIEDDKVFDEVAALFEERLAALCEDEDME